MWIQSNLDIMKISDFLTFIVTDAYDIRMKYWKFKLNKKIYNSWDFSKNLWRWNFLGLMWYKWYLDGTRLGEISYFSNLARFARFNKTSNFIDQNAQNAVWTLSNFFGIQYMFKYGKMIYENDPKNEIIFQYKFWKIYYLF